MTDEDFNRIVRMLAVTAGSDPVAEEAMRAIEAMMDEIELLWNALKPFAVHNNWSEDWHDGSSCEISVQLRDIRRAASLVAGYDWKPDVD